MSARDRAAQSGVRFGAAYYAEYHSADRTETDLDLMKAAGFTVIRVGESVWSTWEPRDGEMDLEWLQPVLDAAHRRGIDVILGTPTYAVPPWLQTKHPEIAAESATGVPLRWGTRQEIDYTHPAFRFHAERVVRAILGRYADHPAVVGFQVDNEPGLHLLHNEGVFRAFVAWLEEQYGTPEDLNREWGLTYWSHRITDWDQLWVPDGNGSPQYDLAWRRFQSQVTTELIAWQAGIVREYSSADQFVTTCIAYPRQAVDDQTVSRALDVASGNPYYAVQDHLDLQLDLPAVEGWTTSGVAGLVRQADRLYSSKQDRFLVTETNAQSIGGSDFNLAPYEGQIEQAALAMVSRGAAMIEYWHWHTLPYGTETYWGGVLPHSLEPGRTYREVARLGARLQTIGGALEDYVPDADVAVLWSQDSRYALRFMPPFRRDEVDPDRAYEHVVGTFHRAALDAGGQSRVLHVEQAHAVGAAELARRYPVLVAAGLYVTSDADLDLLREYAEHGGHLVLGIRTGYADEEARARVAVAPDRLSAAAGVRYEEFSTLQTQVPLTGTDGLALDVDASASLWADGLVVDDATVLARYDHPHHRRFAAVTRRAHGAGQVTTVGTVPTRAAAAAVLRSALAAPLADTLVADRPASVLVSSGLGTDGRRVWFVFCWGWEPRETVLARDVTDLESGEHLPAGTTLELGSWGVRVLADA